MTWVWHLGMAVGLLGFGICAARSVCKREHGDSHGQNEQANLAVAFLVVALVSAAAAAWW